jgi:choline dehydrogenase-like flavoprotein
MPFRRSSRGGSDERPDLAAGIAPDRDRCAMILDARSLPTGTVVESEVCIIGAGAAGITLAREFSAASFRVVLLESGGMEYEEKTEDLYDGRSIGLPFQDLTASRLRYFGGTTNHWGGWCLPYEAIDFEAREGLPYRGWPFSRAYLDPWYRRAQAVCQLGPYDYSAASWGIRPEQVPSPFRGPDFVCKILQQSPPTRFGKVYKTELQRAPRLDVYLYANALKLKTGDKGAVEEVSVGTLSGVRFTVRARFYVLAAGGIENARLLLLSGEEGGPGLGNAHDLVGRFFMVNLCYSGGVVAPSDPYTDFSFYTGRDGRLDLGFVGKHSFISFIGLSAEAMRRRQLPSVRIMWMYRFSPVLGAVEAMKRLRQGEGPGGSAVADLVQVLGELDGVGDFLLRKALLKEGVPVEALDLGCTCEQMPNRDSRVMLDTVRDALGLRRVLVDWQLIAEDRSKAATTLRLLGAELGRSGFGRLRSPFKDDDTAWPPDFFGDEHHMGTTRMHRDAALGVVDADCRVHDLANLYVAGSSVFPTSSSSNPTLTIVALALRLADHLKERFA